MWLEAAHIGRCKTLGHFCPYSHTPRKCLICTLLLTNLYLLLHLSLFVSTFLFFFFFLTQSSHAFDFSFQTLFLRVTHNAKKRDRETSPASNQTPWPWPCPLFCLTAQSQANTGRFPLSQAGEGGGFGSLAGDQIYGTVTIPHSPSDEVAESVAESDP